MGRKGRDTDSIFAAAPGICPQGPGIQCVDNRLLTAGQGHLTRWADQHSALAEVARVARLFTRLRRVRAKGIAGWLSLPTFERQSRAYGVAASERSVDLALRYKFSSIEKFPLSGAALRRAGCLASTSTTET